VPVIVVDSMQVYREIPHMTNQIRERPAELLGVASVSGEWTMARHRAAADAVIEASGGPFLLDAGTGMYLNALLFDVPIARKVSLEVRERAVRLTKDAPNPRRASRQKELELSGEERRGSIWQGALRFDLTMIYLRPERILLDTAIEHRSSEIVRGGIPEARLLVDHLKSGGTINPSVLQAIGVRELMAFVRGKTTLREAEERISTRTRQLARRQIRWFDKLSKTLEGRAKAITLRDPSRANPSILMSES
jgi:tRNA dimethylallyltransferase